MATKEIKSDHWDDFCERVSNLGQRELLTIEFIGQDGIKTEVATDEPLQDMRLNHDGDCNDVLAVNVGSDPGNPLTHTIVDPIHIWVRAAEDGRYNPVEIDAENGVTILRFHPGLRAQLVEEMAGR